MINSCVNHKLSHVQTDSMSGTIFGLAGLHVFLRAKQNGCLSMELCVDAMVNIMFCPCNPWEITWNDRPMYETKQNLYGFILLYSRESKAISKGSLWKVKNREDNFLSKSQLGVEHNVLFWNMFLFNYKIKLVTIILNSQGMQKQKKAVGSDLILINNIHVK